MLCACLCVCVLWGGQDHAPPSTFHGVMMTESLWPSLWSRSTGYIPKTHLHSQNVPKQIAVRPRNVRPIAGKGTRFARFRSPVPVATNAYRLHVRRSLGARAGAGFYANFYSPLSVPLGVGGPIEHSFERREGERRVIPGNHETHSLSLSHSSVSLVKKPETIITVHALRRSLEGQFLTSIVNGVL